jgi:translation initiation factor IF-3
LIYGGAKVISDYSINEQIRDKEVRLIGEDGEQIGIVSVKEAMQMAREADLDLVKISPNAKPPVCKIIDYGKFRYEQMRKDKEAKKKQKVMETKEVRLSPNIDVNDLNTKANQARKFLGKGDKVKVSLRFRGREMAHVNVGKEILDSFYEKLSDIAVVDKPAKLEGRSMVMFLAEKK